ncbi:hypothetical protein PLICRDRAFT_698488 [Plicaturopsis crispa FD-325 SS-3]|nr:hypothetical protein PLICRDRAFT_698488 [Plicaturopsis crispa FD-325 SS-3]
MSYANTSPDLRPSLPDSLQAWKTNQGKLEYWEQMRPFFRSKGYELYKRKALDPLVCVPWDTPEDLPHNGRGVYGSLQYVPEFTGGCAQVWGARSRLGEHVAIKVISCGEEGSSELDMLKFLSREPAKSDPDNHTLPVIEFIELESWHFAVFPQWGKCDLPPFQTAAQVLDFCIQIAQRLSFFHRHLIAHLDIAFENILMNLFGYEQVHERMLRLNIRNRFPLIYSLIDFGYSRRFLPSSARLVSDMYAGRPHKAPELDLKKPYDPFAADVYQLGKVFISYFYNLTVLPEFLSIIQDMTAEESGMRITMAEAERRLCKLRDEVPQNVVQRGITVHFVGWANTPPDAEVAKGLREYMASEKAKDDEHMQNCEHTSRERYIENISLADLSAV